MDFWRTVLVLFRRWYITVPAFVLTLFAAGAAASVVPVQYESGATLVLTTPLTGGTETTNPDAPTAYTNPLLSFDQSLALSASIVIQQMNSMETARALGVTPGGTTTYEVNNGTTNPELLQSGPLLFVAAKASSPEAAQEMAEKVANMSIAVLDQRQTELNAPPATHITVEVVVPPTVGRPLADSPMRAAAAGGALAGLASLAAVYGFESLMTRRRRRRDERVAAAETRSTPSDPPGGRRYADELHPTATGPRVNGAPAGAGR